MNKFTEGPWTIENISEGSGYGINGANGESVVWWTDSVDEGLEREADAYLIVAAPIYYDFVCELIDSGLLNGSTELHDKMRHKAFELQAKARGEK